MIKSEFPDLIPRAKEILLSNDAGVFTKPGPRQYPHQWNWDSAVIALGLAHYDLPRALTEIRSLIIGQWRDGMIPHVVYHITPSDYFPDPAFWQIENSPYAPSVATSGITQPPLLSSIVRTIHIRTPIPDFIREVYPSLLRWHRWLHTARDVDQSGMVCLIHPWESGTDDSPRWLKAMAAITPTNVPPFRRGDTQYVAPAERPHHVDYERFVHLIDVFRRNHYDPSALLSHSPFLVQDILFNSILYRANDDLRALAIELNEPTAEIDSWLIHMQVNFDMRFWDKTQHLYFDYDVRNQMPIRVNTAMTFAPLYAGILEPHRAQQLIDEHWLNPAEYGRSGRVQYALTTVSKSESMWEARRYWRGPIWIVYNWLMIEGLKRYGYHDLADGLRRDSLDLIARSGFREYYDPRDGSGCGSLDFSWPAALAIELLSHA